MRQVARKLQTLNNRVFNRITRETIGEGLARLGLSSGDTVYARVSMRSLGYARGGPQDVIAAVFDVIGQQGTLVMPATPTLDPAQVSPGDLFDVAETPSAAGLLTEALRRYPGARRSLHPVASLVAAGARAEELTAGHEEAATPFGEASPWGRLAALGPRLLLMGAHLGPLLYHIQDLAGFPNLYTADKLTFDIRDGSRRYRTIQSRAIRGDLPPVVILPGGRPESREYLLMPDYALMFPPRRQQKAIDSGYLRFNQSRFLGRRDRLVSRGILKIGRIGLAESAVLDGARLLAQVVKDLIWDIQRFKEDYDPEHLSLLSLPLL